MISGKHGHHMISFTNRYAHTTNPSSMGGVVQAAAWQPIDPMELAALKPGAAMENPWRRSRQP
jgi:hypothetical protein